MSKDIKAIEFRHATHVSMRKQGEPDVHVVKELIHYTDGTSAPNLRTYRGFKRPYWITKRTKRNHEQKKHWEQLSNVDAYECTEDDMRMDLTRKLNIQGYQSLRDICSSQYVYGADIPSTAIMAMKYAERFPDVPGGFTPYSVAVLDLETKMIGKAVDKIIMGVVTDGNWLRLPVLKSWIKHDQETLNKLVRRAAVKYLPEEYHNFPFEITVVDDEVELIASLFEKLHQEQPDIAAIWNMDFDIPVMLDALAKHNVDPASIFNDPRIPPEQRYLRYKRGRDTFMSESGPRSLPIEERWHYLFNPASFVFVDQMCTYFQVRRGGQKEPKYKLDSILEKHNVQKKLKFEEAKEYSDLAWHNFMQDNYPIEYCLYCIWDGLGPLALDNETLDLKLKLPKRGGFTPIESFNSSSTRTAVRTYHECLEDGLVLATLGDPDKRKKFDVLSRSGLVVTLDGCMVTDAGMRVFKDFPSHRTLLRGFVEDTDCVGAYPTDIRYMNISDDCTHKEVKTVQGIPEAIFIIQGINLTQGRTNALTYGEAMFGTPTTKSLLEQFDADMALCR